MVGLFRSSLRYECPFRRRELHIGAVMISDSLASAGIKLIKVDQFRIHLSSLLAEIM